jgi:Domain of unknown function (DUF932)
VVCGTDVRVVCQNTIQVALGGRGKSELNVSFNHRKEFDAELVKESLGVASDKLKKYKEVAEFLSTKRFKKEQLEEYFRAIFPSASKDEEKSKELSRPAKQALGFLESQPGAELGEGTWWQPFNAVTFYIDHQSGRTEDTRQMSAWYGQGKNKKLLAMEKALDFANQS